MIIKPAGPAVATRPDFPNLFADALVFIGGQSNAVGYDGDASAWVPHANPPMFWYRCGALATLEQLDAVGTLDQLSESLDANFGEARSGGWVTLRPHDSGFDPHSVNAYGQGNFWNRIGGGLELGLGNSLTAPERAAIIKLAYNGLSIDGFIGVLVNAERDLRGAVTGAIGLGFEFKRLVFVWLQGETDMHSQVAAQAYYANLGLLRQAIVRLFPSFPLTMILVEPTERNASGPRPYEAIVDAAQRQFVADDPATRSYIPTGNLSRAPHNPGHFDFAALETIGALVAAKIN